MHRPIIETSGAIHGILFDRRSTNKPVSQVVASSGRRRRRRIVQRNREENSCSPSHATRRVTGTHEVPLLVFVGARLFALCCSWAPRIGRRLGTLAAIGCTCLPRSRRKRAPGARVSLAKGPFTTSRCRRAGAHALRGALVGRLDSGDTCSRVRSRALARCGSCAELVERRSMSHHASVVRSARAAVRFKGGRLSTVSTVAVLHRALGPEYALNGHQPPIRSDMVFRHALAAVSRSRARSRSRSELFRRPESGAGGRR